MPELHFAECRCELVCWAFECTTCKSVLSSQSTYDSCKIRTDQGTEEDTHIAGESKEAKSSCLSVLRAILRDHGSDGDNRSSKDATQTSEQCHLPQGLAHSKESRSDSQAQQGYDEHRFSPVSVRCLVAMSALLFSPKHGKKS